MMQAIGSSITAVRRVTPTSTGVLDAQLNRYQAQLADWCNCPSGKTPEGKAKIQELQGKVGAIKAQLQRIAADKPSRPSAAEKSNVNPASATNADPSLQDAKATPSALRSAVIGGVLDVFA